MALSTADALQQRTATAIIRQLRVAQRRQRLAKLTTELERRCTNLYLLARRLGLSNPDRIYKILDGTRPAPADFLDTVCGLTGIPLKAVLSADDYRARAAALRDDMYLEDAERMGY